MVVHSHKVRLVLLAGGFGTRVSHLLPGLPKPMAPCAGRPFLEWVVRFFAHWGFDDFVLSTGHLAECIEAHFASGPVAGVKVTCRRELKPLGTAGGFLNCVEPNTADIWVVANGDSLVVADPRPLVSTIASRSAPSTLLGLKLDDASRFGTLDLGPNGEVRAFMEKRPGAGAINGGVYAFSDELIRSWPSTRPLSFEVDVFPELAHRRALLATLVDAPFIDIGTPASLAQAEDFIITNSPLFSSP